MTFWRVLRERPTELRRVYALTPHARAQHEAAFELPAELDDLERARRVWVKLTQSRGAARTATSSRRRYIDPASTETPLPGYLDGYVDRMAAAAARLHNVSLESRPTLQLIDDYGRSSRVLICADPPYLGSTRNARARYKHEMLTDAQHIELADALRSIPAAVVISGYASPLYEHLYDGWDRVDIRTTTGQGGTGQDRTEVLWSNRPISDPQLFSPFDVGAIDVATRDDRS